jgi:hypothetical protein
MLMDDFNRQPNNHWHMYSRGFYSQGFNRFRWVLASSEVSSGFETPPVKRGIRLRNFNLIIILNLIELI